MKTVELLVTLTLLVFVFGYLYKDASEYRKTVMRSISEFNKSTEKRRVNSIVRALKAYGAPFEYTEQLDFSLAEGVYFDPATGKYHYNTYRRN